MHKKLVSLSMVICLMLGVTGLVKGADLTGDQVLEKIEESKDATTGQLTLKMEIYDGSGNVRNRKLKSKSKDKNGEKSLIRFTSPANVEGTGFLSKDKPNQDDEDMYLYLPALGSVRRISGSQKNGSFVGTDFNYNDLSILGGGSYKEDYNATVLETSESQYILRLKPKDDDIDYKYCKMWVDAAKWYPTKIEFYDSEGQLKKVLTNYDLKEIDGYWTAQKVVMKNVQEGSKTVLYLKDIIYNQSISDRVFSTRNLRRY